MRHARSDILDWTEQGRIAPEKLREALEAGGTLPGASDWRRFLDRLLLWMGVVMLASSVIFFFAFNWQEMGRLAKVGLAQLALLAALGFVWRLGLEGVAGKVALFGAALLVGALFALIGQIYQTGADPWELFAAWAGAILPWVLLARLPALWLAWLVLLNLALSLYYHTFGLMFGMLFAPEKLLWMLFGLNTVALLAWELTAGGPESTHERWSVRLLATASGTLATMLALSHIFGGSRGAEWGLPAWLVWLGAAYLCYRHWLRDVYVLAGGVLSAIVVLTSLMAKQMKFNDAGALLFIGLVVIGLSAAGGYWLKTVANEGDGEGA
jgi:uncharacterized membrane protein